MEGNKHQLTYSMLRESVNSNPRSRGTAKRVLLTGLAATAIYLAACIPNSIKMSRSLAETRLPEVYQATAEQCIRISRRAGTFGQVRHESLDILLEKVDYYLRSNDSFRVGQWAIKTHTEQQEFGVGTVTTYKVNTPTIVFCYNPFKKIDYWLGRGSK